MDIRKSVNENQPLAIGVVLVLLAVCGWYVYGQVKPTGTKAADSGYFSVDDGKTWFIDSASKMPPFEHEGKEAVRVRMYRCVGSNEPFIGYLERYTAKGKAVLQKYKAEQAAKPGQMPASLGELTSLGQATLEFKKPGDSNWLLGGTGPAMALVQVKCKDGSSGFVAEVD